MHAFDAPAPRHKVVRQPIEKLRMAGHAAAQAQVIGVIHKTPAKMLLPDAIDHDAAQPEVGRSSSSIPPTRDDGHSTRQSAFCPVREQRRRPALPAHLAKRCRTLRFDSPRPKSQVSGTPLLTIHMSQHRLRLYFHMVGDRLRDGLPVPLFHHPSQSV